MPEVQTVKLYVIGPPVTSISTLGVFVQDVLQGFSDSELRSFQLKQFQKPLTYHVNFAKTPFSRTPKKGQGMWGLHLWTLQCSWWGHPLANESFSVVVKDADFFGMKPRERPHDAELKFATFTISCPKNGEVTSGNVYELFTTHHAGWTHRDTWFTASDNMLLEVDLQTREALATSEWQDLLDLNALFPKPVGAHRKSRRRTAAYEHFSLVAATQPVRFDTIFPHGLHIYLADSAPRPATYQKLCEDLWKFQLLHMETDTFEKPLHFEQGCAFNKVMSEKSLSEFWWTTAVVEAGAQVHELMAMVYKNYPPQASENGSRVRRHDNSLTCSRPHERAAPVWGISRNMQKILKLPSNVRNAHEIYAACLLTENRPSKVHLGGHECTFIQGLAVNSVYLQDRPVAGALENEHAETKDQRLVAVRWRCNDKTHVSLHFIRSVDRSKGYLCFASPVYMTYPRNHTITCDIWIGSHVTLKADDYAMLADRNKVLQMATDVPEFCYCEIFPHVIPHKEFLPNLESGTTMQENLYVCLGGPGVGKTMSKLVPALRSCAQKQMPCMLTSSLTRVRNTHIGMLKSVFSEDEFDRVLCVGSHDLDALAQSRTLNALTCKAMKHDVEQHEALLAELHHALEKIAGDQDTGERHGHQDRTHLSDAMQIHARHARELHQRVAENRCRLDDLVEHKQSEILRRCTVVVGTLGAATNKTNLEDIMKMLGDRKFGLLATDEISKLHMSDYTRFLARLKQCIDRNTKFALIGDPCQTSHSRKTLPFLQKAAANYGAHTSPVEWLFKGSHAERNVLSPGFWRVCLL